MTRQGRNLDEIFVLEFFKGIFIYLSAPGLNCGRWHLLSVLQCGESFSYGGWDLLIVP